jgi:hypothetical protein
MGDINEAPILRVACTGSAFLRLEEIEDFQGGLKKRGPEEINKIIKSLVKFGFSFPFFVWRSELHNYCLDGHGRILALTAMQENGYILPAFPVVFVEAIDAIEAKQKLLRMNSQYGIMTAESIAEFMDGIDFDPAELAIPSGYLEFEKYLPPDPAIPAPSLADRFGVPPFSVLDARQGWWRERKEEWKALGLRSELGRGEDFMNLEGAADRHKGYARAYGQDIMKGEWRKKA